MGTFIAAYTIVWLAMALYVARLRNHQRHLARLVDSLQARAADQDFWADSTTHPHPGV